MPFKSKAQRSLCWVLYNKALAAGRRPKWDCREFARPRRGLRKGGRQKVLPYKLHRLKRRTVRLYKTKRGATFYRTRGKKVYVSLPRRRPD